MATSENIFSSHSLSDIPSGEGFKIGIVVSTWNRDITAKLLEGCLDLLIRKKVKKESLHVVHVPGSFELPCVAKVLDDTHNLDAIICLGCIIKGETDHNTYISQAVASGLIQLSLLRSKPVIFGVITPDNTKQAEERAGGKYGNKGAEAAATALSMVAIKKSIVEKNRKKIGF